MDAFSKIIMNFTKYLLIWLYQKNNRVRIISYSMSFFY